jgi:hypothetical protein
MNKVYNGVTLADQKASDVASPTAVHPDNMDLFTVNRSSNEVTYAPDGTPDHCELVYPFSLIDKIDLANKGISDPATIRENARKAIEANPADTALNDVWATERVSYPGLFFPPSTRITIRTSMLAKASITPVSSMTTIWANPIIFPTPLALRKPLRLTA